MRKARKYAAEFMGTFALVFPGTGAIIINDVTGGAVTNVGVGLTFGMIVMTMIYAVGDVSGAHFNPAVTLGFFAARRLEGKMVLPYVLSQFSGAAGCEFAFARIIPAAFDHGNNCSRRVVAPIAHSRNHSHGPVNLCNSQCLRRRQGARNYRRYRLWVGHRAGSPVCRPDFRCVDESSALLCPGLSLSTPGSSLDLRSGTGCRRAACSCRLPVRSKRLLFCSSSWHGSITHHETKGLVHLCS